MSVETEKPLFVVEKKGHYLPTEYTRGPWDDRHTHGGPPAALLMHALENEVRDQEMFIARTTIDLFRPVKIAPLTMHTNVIREGRRIKLVEAYLSDDRGVTGRASCVMLRRTGEDEGNTVTLPEHPPIPDWRSLPPSKLDFRADVGLKMFHLGVEVRHAVVPQSGRSMVMWFKMPYVLFPGRPMTHMERVAGLSDFTNVVGSLSADGARPFINADITLAMFREPKGEWLCIESIGRGDRTGIATSGVNLHDDEGFLGTATTVCLAN